MKKILYSPFGDMYTIEEVKADSDRSLTTARKRITDRVLAKMRKANEKHFGIGLKCLLAVSAVTVLSVNSFV
jgi:hypothetical protein